MNEAILESLLYQEESATLDFKVQQYSFVSGTPEQKGELLKDILAFANSWRQTDAYILIGVKEVRGGRSLVPGIPPSHHLDDHSLQQFVCNKTNRPVPFSYAPFAFDGVEIGVFTMPVPDQRPFYLKDNFGRLEKNVVYIRRGSSTDQAPPDEVAKMGANSAPSLGQPVLQLEFCDPETRKKCGRGIEVHPLMLELPEENSFPIYGRAPVEVFGTIMPSGSYENNDYYVEVGDYLKARYVFCPISLAVTNSSTILAEKVIVTFEFNSKGGVHFADEGDMPVFPSSSTIPSMGHLVGRHQERRVDVGLYGEAYEARIDLGNIQPGRTEYSSSPFYLTSEHSREISLEATISANNLRGPTTATVEIKIEPIPRTLSVEDIVKYGKSRL
jgi:hypothetical protein